MNLEELRKLADSFFEWPTEDRTQVTLTSALLFAQHVLRETQQQAEPVRWMYEDGSVGDIDCGHTCIPLYTAPQAQPAPIPTAWQPIETAPTDALHVRGLWVYEEKGKPLSFDCDAGRIDDDGFFVDEFGNPHGWSARDYTHWHPLEVPPAPGGEG